jgi:predicted RNA binding protein YcfA (HicA-like mRNA interferase family)
VPELSPVSWKELVHRLREFGFIGPVSGGKHPYMVRGALVLTIPNRHRSEVSVDLLTRILRQAGVSREEWLGGR